jgi:hypothetical protein
LDDVSGVVGKFMIGITSTTGYADWEFLYLTVCAVRVTSAARTAQTWLLAL